MIRPIKAIVLRNLIKLSRDKMRLFFTLFMSGLFLFIFSFVTRSAVAGLEHPMNYLISGIVIMTVFQTSLNNSMNILEDISNGFMKEILVAPVTRWQIAIGQVISSMIVAVFQGIIIVLLGLFMGLKIDLIHGVTMAFLMCLVGLTFSSLGLYLATVAKESTNFQLVITIVSFPLTFLSGAYIPTMAIPKILAPVIYLNPLTYTTSAFRYIALHMENVPVADLVKAGIAFNVNGFIIMPLMSTLLIIVMGIIFFTLCVNRFNKADFSRVKVFRHGHR
ncbi:MAG TPA: ABC transporter permease [Ignavibacteriales bacterium]|nr:ABC transporter permease [Ignavibacteriales bacterium]